MKKFLIISVLIIMIVILGWYFWRINSTVKTGESPISEVFYLCGGNKNINASFYKGSSTVQTQPGEPPIPTGSVSLILSDGRKLDLPQTISASGIRYGNGDE